MSHVIFRTAGKQFRVAVGDRLRIPRIDGVPGSEVAFNDVLALEARHPDEGQPLFGTPSLPGARVEAQILRHGLDDKVIVYKFRRRKRYRRKNGHRQPFTELSVTGFGGMAGLGMAGLGPAQRATHLTGGGSGA